MSAPRRFKPAVSFALCLLLCVGAAAADDHWQASTRSLRNSLLELYTSEGCSSCPPATRWLRSLGATGLAPAQVIPLAFHVDYWDNLGWKDRFAQPEHSLRQRHRAIQAGVEVYTPQFLVNGQAFMNTRAILREIEQAATEKAQADIHLAVRFRNEAILIEPQVRMHSDGAGQVYLAVYESGLSSDVDAGENRGRVLQHDYVVRQLLGPLPPDAAGASSLEVQLPSDWNRQQLGVAVFVQQSDNGRILQALDLPLSGLSR